LCVHDFPHVCAPRQGTRDKEQRAEVGGQWENGKVVTNGEITGTLVKRQGRRDICNEQGESFKEKGKRTMEKGIRDKGKNGKRIKEPRKMEKE
jgi:hypothetical protein